jgi:uridylate kinase
LGLYSSDPNKDKNAKFIEKISWKDFNKIASKIEFKAGQHFVLDQEASKIIMKNKIRTIILGPNVRNLKKFMKNKNRPKF